MKDDAMVWFHVDDDADDDDDHDDDHDNDDIKDTFQSFNIQILHVIIFKIRLVFDCQVPSAFSDGDCLVERISWQSVFARQGSCQWA